MPTPTPGMQAGQRTNVQGLAAIAEANSRIMEGLGQHLREMNVKQDVVERANECARMCREVAEGLRR